MDDRASLQSEDQEYDFEMFTLGQKRRLDQLIASTRARKERFVSPSNLFCDPAWDILLDLFDATMKSRAVSITSACAASGVAQTTALRYIRVMEDEGLITRRSDETHARRAILSIAAPGFAAMHSYVRWLEEANA
jgi:predicted transcriptional regulator